MFVPLPVDTLLGALREWRPRGTAKHVARLAGVPLRTARGWLYDRRRPSGEALWRLTSNDDVRAALLRRRRQDGGAAMPFDGSLSDWDREGWLAMADRAVAEVEHERRSRRRSSAAGQKTGDGGRPGWTP